MKVELEKVGMKASHMSRRLEELDRSIKDGNDGLRAQLQSLQAVFQEAESLVKERLILGQLAFADMDARYKIIPIAETDTFHWIFNSPQMLLEKEPNLTTSFTDWLESGSGIFHIVGNPGSGKSTLMKFLWEREETQEYLQKWAEDDGKELIFCKFFFWRITTSPEQKTLKGLIRSLLHDVISEVPSICRRLFPKQWDTKKGASQRRLRINIRDSEISDAFEALMNDTAIFDKYRLCFFIDGLDEFEQNSQLQSDTHASLAAKLQRWATESRGHVKICVSSRPLPEFTRTFPISQRITLQKLTESDFYTLVVAKLERNARFDQFRRSSAIERLRCDGLVQSILKEAKGVFLWVSLVLNELEQELATCKTLDPLERIVDTAQQEVRAFIKTILESIPPRHQVGSCYFLALVMRNLGILTSEEKAAAAFKADIESAVSYYREQEYHVRLEECAMFFDADEK